MSKHQNASAVANYPMALESNNQVITIQCPNLELAYSATFSCKFINDALKALGQQNDVIVKKSEDNLLKVHVLRDNCPVTFDGSILNKLKTELTKPQYRNYSQKLTPQSIADLNMTLASNLQSFTVEFNNSNQAMSGANPKRFPYLQDTLKTLVSNEALVWKRHRKDKVYVNFSAQKQDGSHYLFRDTFIAELQDKLRNLPTDMNKARSDYAPTITPEQAALLPMRIQNNKLIIECKDEHQATLLNGTRRTMFEKAAKAVVSDNLEVSKSKKKLEITISAKLGEAPYPFTPDFIEKFKEALSNHFIVSHKPQPSNQPQPALISLEPVRVRMAHAQEIDVVEALTNLSNPNHLRSLEQDTQPVKPTMDSSASINTLSDKAHDLDQETPTQDMPLMMDTTGEPLPKPTEESFAIELQNLLDKHHLGYLQLSEFLSHQPQSSQEQSLRQLSPELHPSSSYREISDRQTAVGPQVIRTPATPQASKTFTPLLNCNPQPSSFSNEAQHKQTSDSPAFIKSLSPILEELRQAKSKKWRI